MEAYYWDTKIEYLRNTRDLYYNDDYLSFLVNTVWRIDRPVRMIDFGCGYGYLGLKLLPMLPKGTTYTGLDKGQKLISQAREIFKSLPYEAAFIEGDIQQTDVNQQYDLAICHAFLMHMQNPQEILKKMTDSVVDGGRIICFESHWISNMADCYVHGIDQSRYIQLGILQRLYEQDTHRHGRDGNIGLKLPVYLSELGVKDIQCRVSDKVNFLDPSSDQDRADKLYRSMSEDGFGAAPGDETVYVEQLIARGRSPEEAKQLYDSEWLLSELFTNQTFMTSAANMKITFGNIRREVEAK